MSYQVISILALVAAFVLATMLPINLGAISLVAAFVIGTLALGKGPGDVADAIFAGFPGSLFVILVWVTFLVTGVLTAFGAVVPAAVAIIAPVGMGFAVRHRINPVLMGLSIINGASAGGFSPLSIFGVITNGVVAQNNLPGSPLTLFL